jgi:hypothetical protein
MAELVILIFKVISKGIVDNESPMPASFIMQLAFG